MEWSAAKFFGNSAPGMGAVSAKTLKKYLAAIRSRHVDRALAIDTFSHPSVRRMLAGATSLNPSIMQPYTKKPITKAQLDLIVPNELKTVSRVDNLNLNAAFTLMFAGFMRLGEITYTKAQFAAPDFQYIHATRSDIAFGPDFFHFRLKRSKTDVEKLYYYRRCNRRYSMSPCCNAPFIRQRSTARLRPPASVSQFQLLYKQPFYEQLDTPYGTSTTINR